MKIICTRNNLPLSVAIRGVTGEDCSHLAVVFDDLLVIQSNLLGINMAFFPLFKDHCEIVHEEYIALDLEVEDIVWRKLMKRIGKSGYPKLRLIRDAFCLLAEKLGIRIKKSGRVENEYLCYEIAIVLQDVLGFDLGIKTDGAKVLTPHRVMQMIKAHRGNS